MSLKNSGLNGLPGKAYSEVWVDTANGHGSTGTKIVTYSNVVSSSGSDILYVPDSVLGDSFRINTTGFYSMTHGTSNTGSNNESGITVDAKASDLTTGINSITAPTWIAELINPTVAGPMALTTTKYLQSGQIIRVHDDGANTPSSPGNWSFFRISRVS